MISRRLFLGGAGALALTAQSAHGASLVRAAEQVGKKRMRMIFSDAENGRWGADLTGDDFAGVQDALDPAFLKGTALEVLNAASPAAAAVVLDNLPTVATQGVPNHPGSPGSCEAQSFGYCLGGYTAARKPNGEKKWDASDPANQPSAAWLYKWQHSAQGGKQCPGGTKAVPYAQHLVAAGAPSTARFPYNPQDAATPHDVCTEIDSIDIANPGPDAARLMIGSYKAFKKLKGKKAQYLDLFKSLIRNGHAIAFSGLVPNQYCVENPPLQAGAFVAPQGFIDGSGHGQVIVGFDDSKGPGGAFLVQNSFGPDWNPGSASDPGFNGRIWFGYDAWFKSQNLALIMFANDDRPPSGIKLQSSAPHAPDLYVKEARRHSQGGRASLALVLHASDAVTLDHLSASHGGGPPAAQALNELLRFGYAYVERDGAFQAGRYALTLKGKFNKGHAVTYTGDVEVA